MNFEKQLKSGLKKCPLHKFGADYQLIKDRWYQCQKCKAFYKMDERIDVLLPWARIEGSNYDWLKIDFL